MTVRNSDKNELLEIASGYEKLGYNLYATGNTALYLNKHGIATSSVRKNR
jgi:carbamoyl-phosphate synthase large subunit